MIITPIQHRAIIDLITSTGAPILSLRRRGLLNARKKTADDYSTVTDADFLVHDVVVPGIKSLFPDEDIISEEDKEHDSTSQYFSGWLLDPIDGTGNFARGGTRFGILLSYIKNGVPLHGFAYFPDPRYEIIYYTGPNGKAFKQKVNLIGEEISYGRPIELQPKLITGIPRVEQRYTDVKDFFPSPYTIVENKRHPSCFIAFIEGDTDILAGPDTMCDWDLGALDAIARQLGASFIDVAKKAPLIYGEPRPIERAFMQPRYLVGNVDRLKNLDLVDAQNLASALRAA